MEREPEKELANIRTKEISVVDHGANDSDYFFVKNAPTVEISPVDQTMKVFETIRKETEDKSMTDKASHVIAAEHVIGVAKDLIDLAKSLTDGLSTPVAIHSGIDLAIGKLVDLGGTTVSDFVLEKEELEKANPASLASMLQRVAQSLIKLAESTKEKIPSNFNSTVNSAIKILQQAMKSNESTETTQSKSVDSEKTEKAEEPTPVVEKVETEKSEKKDVETTEKSDDNKEGADVEKGGRRMASSRLRRLQNACRRSEKVYKELMQLYSELGGAMPDDENVKKPCDEKTKKSEDQVEKAVEPTEKAEPSDSTKLILKALEKFEQSTNARLTKMEEEITSIRKDVDGHKESIEKISSAHPAPKGTKVDETTSVQKSQDESIFKGLFNGIV